jgi:hypothetical protein
VGAERTCESCVSIGHGVAPQALAPEFGALCGRMFPLGCVQPPPGRVLVPPLV